MRATTRLPATRTTPTVLIVSAAPFLASLDLFIVNIAFPDIREAFGTANLGAMWWILNAYTLVFAAFMNPAGRPSLSAVPGMALSSIGVLAETRATDRSAPAITD